ncbi:MAG: Type 1 glutamine amidotransferase-like domain-containing protein [Acidobacteriota bacterium]
MISEPVAVAESPIRRLPGDGWLALLGGGELTFGETVDGDAAWLGKTPTGTVGFVPAASGSEDYGRHFGIYLDEFFERRAETIPIYRVRDARRGRNVQRIAESAAVYLGGGVVDQLLEALADTPCLDALGAKLRDGGTVAAITASAQALGEVARTVFGGKIVDGFGWLPGGVVEPNFDPGHDRRLRQLLSHPRVRWGLALAAGAAVLLGPAGEVEVAGDVWLVDGQDGPLHLLSPVEPAPGEG